MMNQKAETILKHHITTVVTWTFKFVFSSFLGIESVNCLAVNAGLTEPLGFMKNILICVPKMNEGLMGVVQHQGE